MAYEIIAMGDAEMLRQAFEGVALIAGGDDFQVMIKVGLVVGLIFGFGKAVMTAKLDIAPMIVGFLAYMIMFAPKDTVHIVDPYGDLPMVYCETPGACTPAAGGVLTVANVPIGIAAPMHVISQFSHHLSDKFSQVFSAPKMFEKGDGYLNALSIFSKLRQFDGAAANNNNDSTNTANVRRSFVRFWRDCVQYALDSGNKSYEAILRSTDLAGSLAVPNVNRDTMLYIDNHPRQVSCDIASNSVLPLFQPGSGFADQLKAALSKGDVSATFEALDDAVKDVTKRVDLSAERLMVNAYVRNAMVCAQSELTEDACVAMTQATEQRKNQWAAEQTLFKQVARPLMSFVEMFVVAATPIMAFLVASGMGVSLAFKYFGMLAWVSLWPVTMTLCNIYIYNAAGRAIAARVPDLGDMNSMMSVQGMESLFTTASDWVSTGGMLASSVPALTLMLVYGAASTATHLAGRLQNGDHLNERIMAPDIVAPSAISTAQSRNTLNRSLGGVSTGMEGSLPQFQIGEAIQASLSNARASVASASTTLSHSYGQELLAGVQKLHSNATTSSFMKSAENSSTRQHSETVATNKAKMVEAGVSSDVVETASHRAGVRAGLGLSALGTGAGVELGADATKNLSARQMQAVKDAWSQMTGAMDSNATAYRTALTTQSGKSITNTLAHSLGESDRQGFQKVLGTLQSASAEVKEGETLSATLGLSGSRDIRSWASSAKALGLGQGVVGAAAAEGLTTVAAANTDRLQRSFGINGDLAQIAGAGMALQQAGMDGNQSALGAINGLHKQITGVGTSVQSPSQRLGETSYGRTLAQGDATHQVVSQHMAGVANATEQAGALMTDGLPAGGVSKASPASAGAGQKSQPANPATVAVKSRRPLGGLSSGAAVSPLPGSLVSGEQDAFLNSAKGRVQHSSDDMKGLVDKVPHAMGVVSDGAIHGAGKMTELAKAHPEEALGAAAAVASLAVGGPVTGSALRAVTGTLGKKLAVKAFPKLFNGHSDAVKPAASAASGLSSTAERLLHSR